MDTTQTMHDQITRYYRIWRISLSDWSAEHPHCPAWIAARIVADRNRHVRRAVVRRGLSSTVSPLSREQYLAARGPRRRGAMVASILLHDTPYRGRELRQIMAAMEEEPHDAGALNDLPSCPLTPLPWIRHPAYGTPEDERKHLDTRQQLHMPGLSEDGMRWYRYHEWRLRRHLAEMDAEAEWQRCLSDPEYRISGYLAESISEWGVEKEGYMGCDGCTYYAAHYAHPERWHILLDHAPVGGSGDGWEQVYPHEHERAERLRATGWIEALRVNDSLFRRTC